MALLDWLWRKKAQPERMTDRLRKVILTAQCHAADARRGVVSLDLLRALALVDRGVGRYVLEQLGLHLEREFDVIRILAAAKRTSDPSLDEIRQQAKQEACSVQHDYIGTEHLVLALLSERTSHAGDMLRSRGVTETVFRAELLRILSNSPA